MAKPATLQNLRSPQKTSFQTPITQIAHHQYFFSHPLGGLGETGLEGVRLDLVEEYELDLDLCDRDEAVLGREEATYTEEDLLGRPSDVVMVELRFLTYSRCGSPK